MSITLTPSPLSMSLVGHGIQCPYWTCWWRCREGSPAGRCCAPHSCSGISERHWTSCLFPSSRRKGTLRGYLLKELKNSPSLPPYDRLLLGRRDGVEITVHAVHRLLLLLGVHTLCEVVGGAIVVPSKVKQDLGGGWGGVSLGQVQELLVKILHHFYLLLFFYWPGKTWRDDCKAPFHSESRCPSHGTCQSASFSPPCECCCPGSCWGTSQCPPGPRRCQSRRQDHLASSEWTHS